LLRPTATVGVDPRNDVFSGSSAQAERYNLTQVKIAGLPLVAERVISAAGVEGMTPRQFLNRSNVSADKTADLLEFSVTLGDPALAQRLATEYARQYSAYRSELDTAALDRVIDALNAQLREFKTPAQKASPAYANQLDRANELDTLRELSKDNAFLVRSADSAEQVQPRPTRNGVLAGLLALFLGLGIAFLFEALDTRVRSAETVGELLGLPMLARLPEPSRRLRRKNQLAMLTEPNTAAAESFRLLRTNLEFVNLERGARTIMVTSAVKEEGKTTTMANLAVALARAGRRVVLVDLDLRRPLVDRYFELEDRPGVTDVALGHVPLEEAITRIAIPAADERQRGRSENGRGQVEGFLEVLGSGPNPPDPGEFVGTRALASIIDELADRADVVLIDAPPLLGVVDAAALSTSVDAAILVVRMNLVRRPLLRELRRILETLPAAKLGFVLTGAESEEGYGYGYGYGRYARDYSRKERQRVG
jgi:Mrp family chromosome partitioning ATPase